MLELGGALDMELENRSRVSSDLRIFCLGEYVFSTLSKGVEDVYGVVYKIAREWSVDFVVKKLLKCMILLNPRLNCHQQARLKPLLSRTVDQLIWQRGLDPRVMRGLVALACPNQDTGLLFGYLMEVIAGLVCNSYTPLKGPDLKTSPGDVESATLTITHVPHEMAQVAQLLYRHYCLEQVYIAVMPSQVRGAVLKALTGGAEIPSFVLGFPEPFPQGLQQSIPVCCITLEPLLCPNGTIATDVVAVIQRSSTISKQHAFLYRGQALYDWLGSSQVPKSPETRAMVLPTDIFRLS